jgi:hypothetical protein
VADANTLCDSARVAAAREKVRKVLVCSRNLNLRAFYSLAGCCPLAACSNIVLIWSLRAFLLARSSHQAPFVDGRSQALCHRDQTTAG